jgi:hypothetical protein
MPSNKKRSLKFLIIIKRKDRRDKIDNNKAEIEVTSGSNYKISNVVISNLNQQG